jgi:hypothetical protein
MTKSRVSCTFALATLLLAAPVRALEVGEDAPICRSPITELSPGTLARTSVCPLSPARPEHAFVAVEVMSVFCSACLENLPNIRTLQAEFGNRATVRFLSLDSSESLVTQYMQRQGGSVTAPVAVDIRQAFRRDLNVTATPTFFIFNRDGRLLYRHLGTFSAATLAEVRGILAGSR